MRLERTLLWPVLAIQDSEFREDTHLNRIVSNLAYNKKRKEMKKHKRTCARSKLNAASSKESTSVK